MRARQRRRRPSKRARLLAETPKIPSAANVTAFGPTGEQPPRVNVDLLAARERSAAKEIVRDLSNIALQFRGRQPVRTSSTPCCDGFGLSLPLEWCSRSIELAAIQTMSVEVAAGREEFKLRIKTWAQRQ
jgi:hypothetical protein